MRVLVACEFSGIVRDAFLSKGHEAVSCDLIPTEVLGPHIQADVLSILDAQWDLMIAHPPCTHLAVSGARWFKDKKQEQTDALTFVRKLLVAPIPRIALENPISVISSKIRKADQIIQPWQFGHRESKAIALWLKNLPRLKRTHTPDLLDCMGLWEKRVHRMGPSATRAQDRSRFYPNIAQAMAEQWGS